MRAENELRRKLAAEEAELHGRQSEVRERARLLRQIARIAEIRQLLGTSGRWESPWPSVAARNYFAGYLTTRIPWHRDRLSFWCTVIYFDLVAGREGEPFDLRDVAAALEARGVARPEEDYEVEEYLRRLVTYGLIVRVADEGAVVQRYSPTRIVAWS